MFMYEDMSIRCMRVDRLGVVGIGLYVHGPAGWRGGVYSERSVFWYLLGTDGIRNKRGCYCLVAGLAGSAYSHESLH